MARKRILDFMQSYRFWLFDVVPSLTPPFYVLGAPFFGFSSISGPEMTLEADPIKQLNSIFKKYAYSGGDVSPITLTRGVRGFDDTMWEWINRAMKGVETTQRNLLLIHYTNIRLVDMPSIASGIANPFEAGEFLPGRAFLLWNCIPTGFKAADFNATSSDVSLDELTVQPSAISVFTLLDPV